MEDRTMNKDAKGKDSKSNDELSSSKATMASTTGKDIEASADGSEKDKDAKCVDGKGQQQRYYLYDKELKRPSQNVPLLHPIPRLHRPRLPFHMHDYVGIYPTADDERFERQLREKRYREYLIYSRPPDIHHSAVLSSTRSQRHNNGNGSEDRRLYREYESSHSSYRRTRHSDRSSQGYRDGRGGSDRFDNQRRHTRHHSRSPHRKSDSVLNGRRHRKHHSSSERQKYSYDSRSRTRSRSPSENLKNQESGKKKEVIKDFDLNIDLHPLMHYIDDKPKLLKESLSILKGKKLDAMIPPIFADLNARELEETLLKELCTLNIASIANVMDGKVVNSELTTLSNKTKTKSKKSVHVTKIKKKLKEVIAENPSPKKKKKRMKSTDSPFKKGKKKHKKKKKKVKSDDDVPAGPNLPSQKTLMELLELEYRAKAIKALLKSQDIDVNSSSKIDEALQLAEPDLESQFEPGTRPIVDDPRLLAQPDITTRFLVDNQYIHPMQIKLEYEEPQLPFDTYEPMSDGYELLENEEPPAPLPISFPLPLHTCEPMPDGYEVLEDGELPQQFDTCEPVSDGSEILEDEEPPLPISLSLPFDTCEPVSDGSEVLEDEEPPLPFYSCEPMPDGYEVLEDEEPSLPISLPLPFHTCEPMPDGYEIVEDEEKEVSEEDEENDEGNFVPLQHEEEDEDLNPRTWFNRWYNSKKVQKNVKSSKMIGKLRSKLRREKALPTEPPPPEPSEEAVPIIGSISEYQTLFSNSEKYKPMEENESNEEKVEDAKVEETEDTEIDDEALWGDIITG